MDQENSAVFGLDLDNDARMHLAEGARWAKFLAIVGFVMCGLIAIFGIFFGTFFTTLSNRYDNTGTENLASTGFGAMAAVIYVGIAVLYFFPCLFLYRYAEKMKNALATNDQFTLNGSFQNLKIMFRYVGILTIIALAFYLIAILLVVVARTATT